MPKLKGKLAIIKWGKWNNKSHTTYIDKINLNSKENYMINELKGSRYFFHLSRSF